MNPFERKLDEIQTAQQRAVEQALAAEREAALRDVFATAALGAFLCAPGHYAANDPTSVAQRAYRYADAMVEERKQHR